MISGAKKFVITTSDRTSFVAIMNDPASIKNKEFKMFSVAISAMSVVHMLAIDLYASYMWTYMWMMRKLIGTMQHHCKDTRQYIKRKLTTLDGQSCGSIPV